MKANTKIRFSSKEGNRTIYVKETATQIMELNIAANGAKIKLTAIRNPEEEYTIEVDTLGLTDLDDLS